MCNSNNVFFADIKETILLLSLYGWVSLASIIDLGSLSSIGFLVCITLCALYKPRT